MAKNQRIPAQMEASDRLLHTSKDSNDKKLFQKMCQITILNFFPKVKKFRICDMAHLEDGHTF
jgi:hypothetical protein